MRSVGCAVLLIYAFGNATRAGAAECALIWAPSGKLDTPALSALLEKRPGLRLTLALAPENAPDPKTLAELSFWGRLELALRIEGDPLLPLIAAYRNEDAVFRLAISRQKHKDIFGEPASGFFPGAGALTDALLPALAAQGLRWAAAGDYRALPDDPWAAKGSLVIVPARPLSVEAVLPPGMRGVFVLDETGALLGPGEGIKFLASLPEEAVEACSATAGELSSATLRTDTIPETPPTFGGELSVWSSGEERKRSWSLYGETVSALTAYQNSGNASLAVLDKATQALYEAQSSRFFRKDGPEAEREGAEFRARLRKVYQTLRQPVPDDLRGNARSPFAGGKEDPSEKTGSEEDSGSVEGGVEGNLLWFSNPEDSTGYRPAGEADRGITRGSVTEPSGEGMPPPSVVGRRPASEVLGAAGQAASADAWTFRSMSVSWDDKEVTFFFILKALEASKSTRFGFDRLMVDLYVDVNHRPRQGSIDLLEGREGFVPQADAWEYALVASPSGAWLLRFVPGQGPVVVDGPRVEADIPNGELRVSVPRSKLRGNPAAWGYLPLALSPQTPDPAGKMPPPSAREENSRAPRAAAPGPPPPVLGEHGSSILGVIAPGRTQKNLGSAASRRRFPFLRVQRRPR